MSNRPSSADGGSGVRQLADSIGVFLVVAVVVGVVGDAVLALVGAPDLVLAGGVRGWLAITGPVVLAGAVTVWLDGGGYDRVGANPTAGGQFAWLALLYVPLASLPTQVAFDAAGLLPRAAQALTVLPAVAIAAWLAFYGGLDRLGIEPGDVGQVAVVGIVTLAVAGLGGRLVSPGALADPGVVVSGALAVQVIAIWVGIGRRLDDRR